MHSITFAKQTQPKTDNRKVRVTEKVSEDGVWVYSRRSSSYNVLLSHEDREPVYEYSFKPQMYVYKNIQSKRKLFKWKIVGILKIPQQDNKYSLISYQHSFWMLIKDKY
ncbi:MAG: hypothetical protein P9X27_06400 [Candidatus Kaelpia aquatica]|nr:hypothetical protein [Candidatus Kaelpia aquatica]